MRKKKTILLMSIYLKRFSFNLAQLGSNGQLDSIELKVPEQAIPGSVGAVVYLTGEKMQMV